MKITPDLFDAFLKCPTKCWLRVVGEPTSGNAYAEWVQAQNESYCAEAAKRLTADLPADECASPGSGRREAHYSAETLKTAKWRFALDVPARTELGSSRGPQFAERTSPDGQQLGGGFGKPNETQMSPPENSHSLTSAATIETCPHAVERIPSAGRGQPAQFIPIRFIYRNKLTKDDKLLLAFDAFVVSEMLGRAVSLGKIIHGDDHAALKVKTSALAGEVRKRLGRITALLASPAPPDLVLNRHCAECEFQARCRKLAVEKDDLSLLASMSAKERQKLRSKGIFTVTQLSYTFRPRRRPRRQRDKREKYHHALKALAIREQKIHIVGSPELKLAGTPVYLDVEGLPDRDFYYLIGVRIGHGDTAVQHSLWADTVADEGKIWREFLALLETIEQPVLIHYGSYEKTFLKAMKERHGIPPEEATVSKSMQASVNLLLHTFAQIYFPGISNGLKDTAGTFGFKWGEAGASGLNAIMWRCQWDELRQAIFKDRLIAYNAQDCEALGLVTNRILQLTISRASDESSQTENADVVQADSEKYQKTSTWKAFTSEVSGFEYINAAAHWNYQRDRVYARNGKSPRKKQPHSKKKKKVHITQVIFWPAARCCPKCKRRVRGKGHQVSKTVQEIIFGQDSLKRRVVKHINQTYRCCKCGLTFGIEKRFRIFRKFGWSMVAYLCYNIVELNIPQGIAAECFNRLFNFNLRKTTVNHMKERFGRYYAETRQKILASIVRGSLVHADETRANIKGKTGFVWVLTNMNEVYYTLADSREGEMVQKLLPDFKGVLVSDFYTAFRRVDSRRCIAAPFQSSSRRFDGSLHRFDAMSDQNGG